MSYLYVLNGREFQIPEIKYPDNYVSDYINPHWKQSGYNIAEEYPYGFAKVYKNSKVGCISYDYSLIVPIEYDLIVVDDSDPNNVLLFCGYDGEFFDKRWRHEVYTGVFDLYNLRGDLLIGGIDWYYKGNGYIACCFGRKWSIGGFLDGYECKCDTSESRWLLLNNNFENPLIDDLKFRIFFKGKRFAYCKNPNKCNKSVAPFNESPFHRIPFNFTPDYQTFLVFDNIWSFSNDLITTVDHHTNKVSGLFSSNWAKTDPYDYFVPLGNNTAAFYDSGHIGIIGKDGVKIPPIFSIITKPKDGWSFGFEIENPNPSNSSFVVKASAFDIKNAQPTLIPAFSLEVKDMSSIIKLLDGGVFNLYKIEDMTNSLESLGINSRYVPLYFKSFIDRLGFTVHAQSKFTDNCIWYYTAEFMESQRKELDYYKNDDRCIYYSKLEEDSDPGAIDPFDGDPDAYWNID